MIDWEKEPGRRGWAIDLGFLGEGVGRNLGEEWEGEFE